MSLIQTCKCEECGAQKSFANHWVMLYERKGNLVVMPVWNDKLLRRSKHFCGRAHASRYIERWIANPAMDSTDTAEAAYAASDLLQENEQTMQGAEQSMPSAMAPVAMPGQQSFRSAELAPVAAPVAVKLAPAPTPTPNSSRASKSSSRLAGTMIARFPHAHDPWVEDEADMMAARASVRYA